MKSKSQALVRLANGVIGALVAVYAFLDDLLLGPILVGVALWVPWYLTFGVAAGLLTSINIACCNWVQRSWDSWIHGRGAKLEARLEKRRRGRLLKHPLGWITRDSDVWPRRVRLRRVLRRLRRNLHGCGRWHRGPLAGHLDRPIGRARSAGGGFVTCSSFSELARLPRGNAVGRRSSPPPPTTP